VGASRRIALLIRSLEYGGAEVQTTVLANGLARSGHCVSLLVFYPGGPLLERVSSQVRLRCLGKRGRWDVFGFVRSLFRVLKEEQPDVLCSEMTMANLVGCLAGLRTPKLKMVWGVRASYVDLSHYHWLAKFSDWLECRLSAYPDLIVSNSAAGRRYAVSRGFPDNERFVVVPNGIDIERFRPDEALREQVRTEWSVLPEETLVGIVGRLDPMKDHATFLEAAARLRSHRNGMRFVSVGAGAAQYAASLKEQARRLGLEERMIWAGPRGDLPAVYNALDLLVSSSAFGEGFSNVLGEAMACGVPCVSTDVGDAREIFGDKGVVIPPHDAEALAEGMMAMLKRARREGADLREQLRQRITEDFSVEMMVQRTNAALETIL
jgi:glycosyltransferase involved in cell wall biosynthesis